MVYQLENLTKEEKELVLNAPAYITVLIAGADDNIETGEVKRSIQLVHTKTYAETQEIREIYKEIDGDFEQRLQDIIAKLPQIREARQAELQEKLSRLNRIFTKIDPMFAKQYYRSLRNFASYIAYAAGGIMGVKLISPLEKEFVHLPMIQEPIV